MATQKTRSRFNAAERANMSKNIKYLLEKFGLTGQRLAEELKIHTCRITCLKSKGSVSEKVIKKIARRFSLSVRQFTSDLTALAEIERQKASVLDVSKHNEIALIVEQVLAAHDLSITQEGLNIVIEATMQNGHMISNMNEAILGMVLALMSARIMWAQ